MDQYAWQRGFFIPCSVLTDESFHEALAKAVRDYKWMKPTRLAKSFKPQIFLNKERKSNFAIII